MMQDFEPRRATGPVEDYTVAFLWMAGLVLFMGLFALWAAYGYITSLLTAGLLRWGIDRLPRQE